MRNIINISLPVEMVKIVKREVKKGKYASVSEFFRALLREHEKNKLLTEIEESHREFKAGKGKVLHSFRDLR